MKGGFDVSSKILEKAFNITLMHAPKDGTHNDQVRHPLEKFKPKYDKIDLMNARMLEKWAGSATKILLIIIIISFTFSTKNIIFSITHYTK
jgi:hypothetical protein